MSAGGVPSSSKIGGHRGGEPLRVAEYVQGELLVLEVASRSRGREILHHLALRLEEDGQVAEVCCSCEGFGYRGACHHLRSLRDMAGAPERRKGRHEA